jgi:hypothetical protein
MSLHSIAGFGSSTVLLPLVMVVLCKNQAADGAEWFVAPDGKASGKGTKDSPWDFLKAMSHPADVKPGDTIWVKGGVYVLTPDSLITALPGAKDAPVTVRGAKGERVTVDLNNGKSGCHLMLGGSWTVYRDMEFTCSIKSGTRPQWWHGNDSVGANTKTVNLVVHDSSNAGMWRGAVDAEMYGCLVYYNGRGDHGHNLYVQNETGQKRIIDNIMFGAASRGIAPHGTHSVINIHVEGNMSFANGTIDSNGPYENLYLWTHSPCEKNVLVGNYTYHPLTDMKTDGVLEMACDADLVGKDIAMRDNHLVGGGTAVSINRWTSVDFTGNRVIGPQALVNVNPAKGGNMSGFKFDKNTYFCTGGRAKPFMRGGAAEDFAAWNAAGFDKGGSFQAGRPKGVDVFLRPNQYEPGRANICIYNWDKKDTVDVDASKSGLKQGEKYVVRDAMNYFGKPVAEGTWDGKAIPVPMTGHKPADPMGVKAPAHTCPEFGVFILRRAEEDFGNTERP